jgi:DNA anti-recombination protein RmuC
LLISPELKELLSDLHRFVDVTEKLPQNFTREQKALVKQAMDRLAKERKNTINDFLAQETRLKGVLTDIKQAATETNKFMISLNSFTDYLKSESPEDSQPFNINDYKETAAEIAAAGAQLNSLVESLDRLLNSSGMERLLPQIEDAITIAGDEGEELIDHSFRQAALLLLIWFVVYIIARLLVSYFSKKIPNFSG